MKVVLLYYLYQGHLLGDPAHSHTAWVELTTFNDEESIRHAVLKLETVEKDHIDLRFHLEQEIWNRKFVAD